MGRTFIVKKETFIQELKEIWEMEEFELDENTRFKTLDGYDSLSIISIIAFVEENFGKIINADKFSRINTIGELISLIGNEHFD